MSRHGYSDNCENLAMWRGIIASATRGKRGQAFFRALVEALDAMPEKRLVEGKLQTDDGSVCALGCLGKAKGIDLSSIDLEDTEPEPLGAQLGTLFDIAPQLAQEVMFVNDEWYSKTPEDRWLKVRKWAAEQIRVEPSEVTP